MLETANLLSNPHISSLVLPGGSCLYSHPSNAFPNRRVAKNTLSLIDRSNLLNVLVSNSLHGTLFLGVGINLRLSPSRDLRFGGGLRVVVRLWNAMLEGRLKYIHGDIVAR